MDWLVVEHFLRVAELGSINKAAVALNMTQPTLSRQMSALEQDFGIELLVRHALGVKLTAAGELLASRATPILAQIHALKMEMGQPTRAQVAIGLPYSLQRIVASRFATQRPQLSPSINLRLYEGFIDHLVQWLKEGTVDLAIMRFQDMNERDFARLALVREQLLVVGSQAAGLRADQTISPPALAQLPLVVPGRPNRIRMQIETMLARHDLPFNLAAELESVSLCLELARNGVGFAVVPYSALFEHPFKDELSWCPLAGQFVAWTAFVRRDRLGNAAVRSVADALVATLRQCALSTEWRFTELMSEEQWA